MTWALEEIVSEDNIVHTLISASHAGSVENSFGIKSDYIQFVYKVNK